MSASGSRRPAGVAEIDSERVDVVSSGDFVPVGEPVQVIRVEGARVVVTVRRTVERGSS